MRWGFPHKKLRSSCGWCKKKKHDRTRSGDTHRFHGPGSFCRTHRNTGRAAMYCTASGKRRM